MHSIKLMTSFIAAIPNLRSASVGLGLFTVLAMLVATHPWPGTTAPSRALTAADALLELVQNGGMLFEVNEGQATPEVDFLARGPDYIVLLSAGEAVVALEPGTRTDGSSPLVIRLLGAEAPDAVEPMDPRSGRVHYLLGQAASWVVDVPTYGAVAYMGVYPGVDIIYRSHGKGLEYDFLVAPGADPRIIRLSFEGVSDVRLDGGQLLLDTESGQVVLKQPTAFQASRGGWLKTVPVQYQLLGDGAVGLETGMYDTSRPLLIDPVLVYSTYLGGSGLDQVRDIALDDSGNAYVAGWTLSVDFPTQAALDATLGGSTDAFVAKYDASGNLVYATYLGGSGNDYGEGIAISGGKTYVVGDTYSTDFPTSGTAFQPAKAPQLPGSNDAYLTVLSADGSSVDYSTYLGGGSGDGARGVVVDWSGNALITGRVDSTNFPTQNPFQVSNGGAFVAKIDPSQSGAGSLVYSTYMGGSAGEVGDSIATDSSGNALVTGYTNSSDFPTLNAFQPTSGGGFETWVAKFNPTGTLLYSTYMGGSGDENLGINEGGIAADGPGNAYVTGSTQSADFPTTVGSQAETALSVQDAFVVKLDSSGNLVYSTYLGGNFNEAGYDIAVNGSGEAIVTGNTLSTDFPVTGDAFDSTRDSNDTFIAHLSASGGSMVYATYLGGTNGDFAYGVAVNTGGRSVVVGNTISVDFPTLNPEQSTNASGFGDAYVTAFDPDPTPTPTPMPTPVPGASSLGLGLLAGLFLIALVLTYRRQARARP